MDFPCSPCFDFEIASNVRLRKVLMILLGYVLDECIDTLLF